MNITLEPAAATTDDLIFLVSKAMLGWNGFTNDSCVHCVDKIVQGLAMRSRQLLRWLEKVPQFLFVQSVSLVEPCRNFLRELT